MKSKIFCAFGVKIRHPICSIVIPVEGILVMKTVWDHVFAAEGDQNYGSGRAWGVFCSAARGTSVRHHFRPLSIRGALGMDE